MRCTIARACYRIKRIVRQKCDDLRALRVNSKQFILCNFYLGIPKARMLAYDVRNRLYDITKQNSLSNLSL